MVVSTHCQLHAGVFVAEVSVGKTALNEVEFVVVESEGYALLGRHRAIAFGVLKLGPEDNSLETSKNDENKTNSILERWKEANVHRVFKKGEKEDCKNYRPISLTCVCCKILEHIVHSHIMKYPSLVTFWLITNTAFTRSVHPKRNYRQLFMKLLLHLMKRKHLIFTKAFNKVPHERLLATVVQTIWIALSTG